MYDSDESTSAFNLEDTLAEREQQLQTLELNARNTLFVGLLVALLIVAGLGAVGVGAYHFFTRVEFQVPFSLLTAGVFLIIGIFTTLNVRDCVQTRHLSKQFQKAKKAGAFAGCESNYEVNKAFVDYLSDASSRYTGIAGSLGVLTFLICFVVFSLQENYLLYGGILAGFLLACALANEYARLVRLEVDQFLNQNPRSVSVKGTVSSFVLVCGILAVVLLVGNARSTAFKNSVLAGSELVEHLQKDPNAFIPALQAQALKYFEEKDPSCLSPDHSVQGMTIQLMPFYEGRGYVFVQVKSPSPDASCEQRYSVRIPAEYYSILKKEIDAYEKNAP